MKKTKILLLSAALSISASMVSFAGEWKQDETGWWYQNDDGSYIASNWYQDESTGTWYYFNSNGYMVTGWLHFTDTDVYYYFDEDGSMRTEPLEQNGYTYTFDETGKWNNGFDSQIQNIYDNESLRLGVKYGYGMGQNYSGHKYSGVNLADENLVYYKDVSKDK